MTKLPKGTPKVDADPQLLLDYRCYVPGGEIGTKHIPPKVIAKSFCERQTSPLQVVRTVCECRRQPCTWQRQSQTNLACPAYGMHVGAIIGLPGAIASPVNLLAE